MTVVVQGVIWASIGEDLSSGFLTKSGPNQPAQVKRLPRTLNFHMEEVVLLYFPDGD